MASHVLGVDVSTTATKAVLIDEAGRVAGIGSASYEYDIPQPRWSEQDPRLWWDGTLAAIRSVLATSGVAPTFRLPANGRCAPTSWSTILQSCRSRPGSLVASERGAPVAEG